MNPWHRYLADPEAHLVRCATSTNPALARLLQPPEEGDDDASGGGPPPDMPPILCHCRSATQLAAVAQALQRRFYGGALRPPDDGGAGFASNGRFMCLRAAGGTGFLDDLVRLTSSRDVCGHRHQLVLHDIHKLTPTQQRQLCCVLDRSSGHCNFLMFAATLSGMHRGITSRCCCVNVLCISPVSSYVPLCVIMAYAHMKASNGGVRTNGKKSNILVCFQVTPTK